MTDDALLAHWQRVEAELRWVLLASPLDPECARSVERYLDHNELGLAWADLRSCLVDPSPEVIARMIKVGLSMGLDWDNPAPF